MSAFQTGKIPGDWYDSAIPSNAQIDATAHVTSTYSFQFCRSRVDDALVIGRGASAYIGTMFSMGPSARVKIGDYTLLNGVWIISDDCVEIGSHCLLSWNIVVMDTYRAPVDAEARRAMLQQLVRQPERRPSGGSARPVRIGNNVWIGFNTCVLPGVTIGEGSIVGAASVVHEDVPPYTAVAGNPARVIRSLKEDPQ